MDSIDLRLALRRPDFSLAVDLRLPGRGVTGLFGPSGSGKTTLLRCLAGLERVPGGEVIFQGEVWQRGSDWLPTHRRPLGYVFQEASLFPHLSVEQNLHYAQERARSRTGGIALDQAIELLGIAPLLGRQPAGLSGGERQRVAIARALATHPRLLLMDEPLAALDLRRKQEILPYLARLRDELDIPLIYVSHAPDEIARLADHLVVMEGGQALAAGTLAETLSRLDLPIRLGEDAGVVIDAHADQRDPDWHLLRLSFAGGTLWTRDNGAALARPVRVRVLARDVSISLDQPAHSSIQNILPAVVDQLAPDEHPGQQLVRLRLGDTLLLARVTRRAAAQLDLAPGRPVFAQIKSVALLD